MKKPEEKVIKYYDYAECREYIKNKYGQSDREFWLWLCEQAELSKINMYNGGFISIEEINKLAERKGQVLCPEISKTLELFKLEFESAKILTQW